MKPEHLGGDRWRVRKYVGINPATGKQMQRTRTFRANGPRQAARVAVAVRAELDRDADEVKNAIGTVADLCTRYERHKLQVANWSPSHADRQHEILEVITADLGRYRLADLSARQVDEWFGVLLGRGLKPSTVAHYHETLRAMLRQGDRWDMCSPRAAEKATVPAVVRDEVVAPTNDAVALLLSEARGALRAAVFVAALAGLRRGEILGLRWSDFDGNVLTVRRSVLDRPGGDVLVKSPKSRKLRRFTVDPLLLDELAVWRAVQAGQFVAAGRQIPDDCFILADVRRDLSGQRPRRPMWLSGAWEKHRATLGADSVRLHDLRHWHLSTLANAGVPMVTVQARGGHSDISTTGIYTHALPEGEERTRGVITAALGPGVTQSTKEGQ